MNHARTFRHATQSHCCTSYLQVLQNIISDIKSSITILQINMKCVYSMNQHMADVEKYFPRSQLSQTLHLTIRENHVQAECNTQWAYTNLTYRMQEVTCYCRDYLCFNGNTLANKVSGCNGNCCCISPVPISQVPPMRLFKIVINAPNFRSIREEQLNSLRNPLRSSTSGNLRSGHQSKQNLICQPIKRKEQT